MSSNRRPTVLVTGASGFVGARFLELASARHDLVAAVRRAPARSELPVEWLTLDLDGQIDAGRLPARLDAVVHLAVSRRHREFPASALQQFRVNLASTAGLLDHALRAGARSFVLMSTGSVYDAAGGELLREQEAVAPRDYFAATKAAAELLLTPYAGELAVSALRLFFPYGPGQRDRLIPNLIERVKEGQPVRLSGDAAGMRLCPIYVDDVVAVLEECLSAGWQGTYNLAGPQVLSLRSVSEAIAEALGTSAVFEEAPGPRLRFEPDLTRLASQMDLTGFRTFRQGVRTVIERG